MELLITGCAAFLLTHLGISGTPLRGVLVNALGDGPYLGVYSLLSFATLGLMIYAYTKVPHADFIWMPTVAAYWITKVLVLVGFLILVMGTLVKNPTAVASESALDNGVTGMLKVTRHPIQWGILLFALGHLIANGDVASIIFFGTFLVLSFFGMLSMDARRRSETDPRWQSFMTETSMLPFAAMISGRQRFTAADINWMGFVGGLGLYAAVYWLHDLVSGGASLF